MAWGKRGRRRGEDVGRGAGASGGVLQGGDFRFSLLSGVFLVFRSVLGTACCYIDIGVSEIDGGAEVAGHCGRNGCVGVRESFAICKVL